VFRFLFYFLTTSTVLLWHVLSCRFNARFSWLLGTWLGICFCNSFILVSLLSISKLNLDFDHEVDYINQIKYCTFVRVVFSHHSRKRCVFISAQVNSISVRVWIVQNTERFDILDKHCLIRVNLDETWMKKEWCWMRTYENGWWLDAGWMRVRFHTIWDSMKIELTKLHLFCPKYYISMP